MRHRERENDNGPRFAKKRGPFAVSGKREKRFYVVAGGVFAAGAVVMVALIL